MREPFDLTDRVAVVTGASRGLGENFARSLARAGANLAITSRTRESLEPLAEELRRLGRKVACVALDVRDHDSIQQAMAAIGGEFPQLDILVNNAGCNIRKPATDVTWDDWNEIVNTNLRGAFFVAQAAAKQMIPRGYGRIINIGSVTCVAGYAGLAPYGASRGGIKQMTMSLAHDWGAHGITVNCLAPGWFKTHQNRALYEDPGWVDYLCERIPLGRPGEMSDLEGALLLFASDAGKYITGQTLLVDGGISVGAVRALPKK
jgi:NAD(P)-dependent dehydrogenase (short-subunit alcohol dehydrogenase family)